MFNLITFLFPCLCPENTIPSSLPRIKLFTDSPGNASDVTETGRDCFAVNSRKSLKTIINYSPQPHTGTPLTGTLSLTGTLF
jgi:hypothetical protein